MLSRFNPKNYLFFKIFIWFWLTIVLTLTMLFVFSQITEGNVENRKLEGPKLVNLERLATSLERTALKKPEHTLKKLASHPRITRHRLLYFIDPNSGASFFNKEKSQHLDTSLLSFTEKLPAQSITTAQYRALGPIEVTHKNKSYLLYEITPWRSKPMAIRVMLMPTWLKLLIVIGATLLLSLIFSRSLINPINALKKASSQLASGELAARVAVKHHNGDELITLANDFNNMAQRLESLVTSQKRLMADVSHELRSPLTRLQMAAGLAQLKQTPEQADYLTRIEKEANNLDKMISDVLKLARLEAQNQYTHMETQPLQSILEQVLKDSEFESHQQNKKLIISGRTCQTLSCDAALIASAFENILRNAIKYAETTIKCEIKDLPGIIEIQISDDGSGVDENELPHLLEPFYRVSQSRERKSGGAGLGLAIAKQAIEVHRGNLVLSSPKHSGLIATITLKYD